MADNNYDDAEEDGRGNVQENAQENDEQNVQEEEVLDNIERQILQRLGFILPVPREEEPAEGVLIMPFAGDMNQVIAAIGRNPVIQGLLNEMDQDQVQRFLQGREFRHQPFGADHEGRPIINPASIHCLRDRNIAVEPSPLERVVDTSNESAAENPAPAVVNTAPAAEGFSAPAVVNADPAVVNAAPAAENPAPAVVNAAPAVVNAAENPPLAVEPLDEPENDEFEAPVLRANDRIRRHLQAHREAMIEVRAARAARAVREARVAHAMHRFDPLRNDGAAHQQRELARRREIRAARAAPIAENAVVGAPAVEPIGQPANEDREARFQRANERVRRNLMAHRAALVERRAARAERQLRALRRHDAIRNYGNDAMARQQREFARRRELLAAPAAENPAHAAENPELAVEPVGQPRNQAADRPARIELRGYRAGPPIIRPAHAMVRAVENDGEAYRRELARRRAIHAAQDARRLAAHQQGPAADRRRIQNLAPHQQVGPIVNDRVLRRALDVVGHEDNVGGQNAADQRFHNRILRNFFDNAFHQAPVNMPNNAANPNAPVAPQNGGWDLLHREDRIEAQVVRRQYLDSQTRTMTCTLCQKDKTNATFMEHYIRCVCDSDRDPNTKQFIWHKFLSSEYSVQKELHELSDHLETIYHFGNLDRDNIAEIDCVLCETFEAHRAGECLVNAQETAFVNQANLLMDKIMSHFEISLDLQKVIGLQRIETKHNSHFDRIEDSFSQEPTNNVSDSTRERDWYDSRTIDEQTREKERYLRRVDQENMEKMDSKRRGLEAEVLRFASRLTAVIKANRGSRNERIARFLVQHHFGNIGREVPSAFRLGDGSLEEMVRRDARNPLRDGDIFVNFYNYWRNPNHHNVRRVVVNRDANMPAERRLELRRLIREFGGHDADDEIQDDLEEGADQAAEAPVPDDQAQAEQAPAAEAPAEQAAADEAPLPREPEVVNNVGEMLNLLGMQEDNNQN